jgi:hypothetical protein
MAQVREKSLSKGGPPVTGENRTRLVQQIPVFALRQMLTERFVGEAGESELTARCQTVLGRKPQKLAGFISRLTRLELTTLINACSELDDGAIQTAFEEYRYGSHPSFHIYLFDPRRLKAEQIQQLETRLTQALLDDNERFAHSEDGSLPRVRDVTLDGGELLPTPRKVYEGSYRCLNRLDYIDAGQNAVSTYETLYGFFWIGIDDGYVTIHARKPDVLRSLKSAIEEAAGLFLTSLVISKQFKNALAFLDPRAFRSSQLYEPDPTAKRFRRLTIADRRAYEKGYGDFESRYPEIRSTRYRVTVGDKETSLSLRCDRGSLSLAGRLQATQFRTWATESLSEVIRVVHVIQATPAAYVQTAGLRQSVALAPLRTAAQKDVVLDLLSRVLTLKQSGKETASLDVSPLDLSIVLGSDLPGQVSALCSEDGCEEDGYVVCPQCEGTFFTLSRQAGQLRIACHVRASHWQTTLPDNSLLSCGHAYPLEESILAEHLELLPGPRLLSMMAQLVNNHLQDYTFDPIREGFFIRGSVLYYYANRDALPAVISSDPRKGVYIGQVIQNIQENYGEITGVLLAEK